jgi:hypothetical protein
MMLELFLTGIEIYEMKFGEKRGVGGSGGLGPFLRICQRQVQAPGSVVWSHRGLKMFSQGVLVDVVSLQGV